MNPLVPNTYDLIIFYIIPALVAIGLVILAVRFFTASKNRPGSKASTDDGQNCNDQLEQGSGSSRGQNRTPEDLCSLPGFCLFELA